MTFFDYYFLEENFLLFQVKQYFHTRLIIRDWGYQTEQSE